MRLKFLSAIAGLEAGERRSALLRLAIASSGLSKVCALGLQALAIPLVYHAFGKQHYDLFLLVTAVLGTVSLIQMGAGPGLTQGMAQANAGRQHELAASLLRAGFRLASATALVGGALIVAVVHVVDPQKLFGAAFAADRVEIVRDVDICALVLAAQVIAGVVDSALAGLQEQVFIHLGSVATNIFCAVLLWLTCRGRPTIVAVTLILYGLPVLPKFINLALLGRRRPYLLSGFLRAAPGAYGALLRVGVAFWAIEASGVLEQNGGNYILAHLGSIQAVALFAVVYKSLGLAGAVVSVVTMPLWPAYADAIAHRDGDWIIRSFRKVRRYMMAYACAAGAVLLLAGHWIFARLLHVDVMGAGALFGLCALYLVSNIWTHLHYVTLMGMERIWQAASVVLVENLLMLLLGVVLVPRLGAAGMALAYLLASALLPAWLLPQIMRGAIGQVLERQTATARHDASSLAKLASLTQT